MKYSFLCWSYFPHDYQKRVSSSIVLELHSIYRWSFKGMLVNLPTSCKRISLTRYFFLQIITHTCKHLGEVRITCKSTGHCPDRATFEVKWAMKPIKLFSPPDFLSRYEFQMKTPINLIWEMILSVLIDYLLIKKRHIAAFLNQVFRKTMG